MTTYAKNSKQSEKKELNRLYRRLQNIWEAERKLPRIKLDKPRFAGYKRFFVLRDDIAKRNDARDLREILFLMNEVRFSKTKDFSKHDVEDKFQRKQSIQTISEKQFENLNPHQKKFFDRWVSSDFRKKEVRYIFQFPYYFVFKIKQHYITEVPLIDTELESLKQEIYNKIDLNNLWPKIDHMIGRHHREKDYNAPKIRILDYLQEKEMLLELERTKDKNGY